MNSMDIQRGKRVIWGYICSEDICKFRINRTTTFSWGSFFFSVIYIKYNKNIVKFTFLEGSSLCFDEYKQLYNHPCNEDTEFHHSENFPCVTLLSLLSLSFPKSQPLKTTDLVSISMEIIVHLRMPCTWNHALAFYIRLLFLT